jgi:hypothetical protein
VDSKHQYSQNAAQSLAGILSLQPFAMFFSTKKPVLKWSFFGVLLKAHHFFPADLVSQYLHKGSILKYFCNALESSSRVILDQDLLHPINKVKK